MTQEEIQECNKLIAEFMELPMHDTLSIAKTPLKAYEWNCNLYSLSELHYHDNWEWLMPVVEKIESLGYIVNIYGHQGSYTEVRISEAGIKKNGGKISFQMTGLNGAKTKINALFISVIDFISWYNKNKK